MSYSEFKVADSVSSPMFRTTNLKMILYGGKMSYSFHQPQISLAVPVSLQGSLLSTFDNLGMTMVA